MKFVQGWNQVAESWGGHVLQAGLISLAMLLLVHLVWLLIRKRVSSHTGFVLFLLPLLPLIVPRLELFVIDVPLGERVVELVGAERVELPADAQAGDASAAGQALAAQLARESSESSSVAAAQPVVEPGATHAHDSAVVHPTPQAWVFAAWLTVIALLLTRFARVQWQTQRMVKRARPLSDEDLAHVRALIAPKLARRGLEYVVQFAESEAVSSPAAWGLRRSTILLPPGLIATLDDEALSWMLLHEVAHLERHDMLVAGVQRVVQILWFFHPVVWLTDRTVNELRECACDEAALVRSPGSKRRHLAEALLEVAAASAARPVPSLALQTLQKESYLMKKRILRLIDPQTPARAGFAFGALPIFVALVGLPFVSWRVESSVQQDDPVVSDEELEVFSDDFESIEESDVTEAAQVALQSSLEFLLAWQHSDGHWPMGPGTDEEAGEFTMVGVTGFVMLAMLDAERDTQDPKYRAAIDKAAAYLELTLDPKTGIFGGVEGTRYMASHAVATRAYLLAQVDRKDETWRKTARTAIDAILRARNPYAAWRFNHLPDGDNDTFTTSLMLMALNAARGAKFEVDQDAFEGGKMFLDEMYDRVSGRTGYNSTGSRSPRLAGRLEDFPAEHTEMTTAAMICARLELGESPMESQAIRRGAALLVDVAPTWSRERGTIDFYSWLFGSQALAQLGGYQFDHWRAKLLSALVKNQRLDKQGRVWWPAVDAWGGKGAVVHSTVMLTLSLQAVLD